MLNLLNLDGLTAILGLLFAAIAGGVGLFFGGKRKGKADEETRARERDHAKSTKIETAADRARAADAAGGDSTERLRDAGRLRD